MVTGEIEKNISCMLRKYKLLSIIRVAKQKCFSGSRKMRKCFKMESKILYSGKIVAVSLPSLKFLYYQCYPFSNVSEN